MYVTSSSQAPRELRSGLVATAVDQPRLIKPDGATMHLFLSTYDKNMRKVQEREFQLTDQSVFSTGATTPVRLKFCVDKEKLELLIDLGLPPYVDNYVALK